MEHGCINHSKSSNLRVLLVPLEFTTWGRARSWTYAAQLGFEEGFIANNVEFFTIPVLQEIPSSSPASWLYYARQLCENKKFDQVWVWLVHPQYDDAFLNWLKEVAPVRVGFLMESLEYTMPELQIRPHLKNRRETAENQMRYMTHILACDEADAEQINKQGQCKTLWYPSAVPERFLAESPVINRDKAIFGGSLYSERHEWLKQCDLQSVLVWYASDENSTDYPKLFDEANRQSIDFLRQHKNPSEAFLSEYLKALRTIRRHCFQLWLNSLKTGCAVVNLPHVFKSYAGRVVEAMAAGRPVISWEIPDRPRTKALFENGKEILLFDKSKPQQLADHVRHVQSNPDFARCLADNALNKVRKFHTIEYRIRQILHWIETGTRPSFGEAGETLTLKQSVPELRFAGQSDLAPKSYFIKEDYQCNLGLSGNAVPYLDNVNSSSSYQAPVYRFAASVIKKYGIKNVLDIGCGFGIKLSRYIYPLCPDITGIDAEHSIRFCREKYNFGKWFTDDIEKPQLCLNRQFDLIIAADVIEHLVNPDLLLDYIRPYCRSQTLIVLSTPERELTRGKGDLGPPVNKSHVREWNMPEFHKYISNFGFKVLGSCLVKDKDVSANENCQLLLCSPGITLQQSNSPVTPVYKSVANPRVSVIMPAYNGADYIAEAIKSVLVQNYRNFELIVIDDGSTDNTRDIVAGFKDERIRYFYQANRGLAAAHNAGIRKSRGDFLIKLDHDDMMMPDFIAGHLQEFERYPEADLVYCDDCLIDENDKPLRVINRREYTDRKSLIRDMFRCGFPVVPFRTCIRKTVFDKIGFFDESLSMAEDYDMMRRFIKNGLVAHHLSGALYIRRIASNSLSRNYTIEKAKCHFDVIRRFIDTFASDELFPDVAWDKIPRDLRQIHAKCLAAVTLLAIGQNYIKSNVPLYADMAFGHARSELTDCLKINPQNQQVLQLLKRCEFALHRADAQSVIK